MGLTETLGWFGFLGMVLGLPLVLGTCLLGAPFASAYCAVLARERGLDARLYATAGVAFSMILFAPLVYLVVRLHDRRPPRSLVKWAYALLYVGWFWGPIQTGAALIERAEGSVAQFSDLANPIRWINLATWVGSLAWLAYIHDRETAKARELPSSKQAEVSDNPMPRLAYVLPFGLATLWSVAILSATVVGLATK